MSPAQKNVCMITCEASYAQINIIIVCGKQLPEKHSGSEIMMSMLSFIHH